MHQHNPPTAHHTIRIAAVVIERADGAIALVRKRNTTAFMQPGGKLEPGETALAAAIREVGEELAISLDPAALIHLGQFSAIAANEADTRVLADVYWARTDATPHIQAEIEELVWFVPDVASPLPLAPLTRHHILPALLAHRAADKAQDFA